jgi:hypothetical protein
MNRPPSPRPIKRGGNDLLIFLHPDEWATDVPLPVGSSIVRLGEKGEIPFYPQWHFFLWPDKTAELLVGWFVVPLGFEETIAWYRTQLTELGWTNGPTEGYVMPEKALLRFQHPKTRVRVEASIQWWQHKEETTAMIRRIVEHPWSPSSNGNGTGAKRHATHTAQTGARNKKHCVQRKAHRRQIA